MTGTLQQLCGADQITGTLPAGLIARYQSDLELRTTTDSLEWCARWLAGLPVPVNPLEPPELKDVLRQHAERLLDGCLTRRSRPVPYTPPENGADSKESNPDA